MKGTIDQVKVWVRTHAPNEVKESEFISVGDAIRFLNEMTWNAEDGHS